MSSTATIRLSSMNSSNPNNTTNKDNSMQIICLRSDIFMNKIIIRFSIISFCYVEVFVQSWSTPTNLHRPRTQPMQRVASLLRATRTLYSLVEYLDAPPSTTSNECGSKLKVGKSLLVSDIIPHRAQNHLSSIREADTFIIPTSHHMIVTSRTRFNRNLTFPEPWVSNEKWLNKS